MTTANQDGAEDDLALSIGVVCSTSKQFRASMNTTDAIRASSKRNG
jgi:hypothetical protein